MNTHTNARGTLLRGLSTTLIAGALAAPAFGQPSAAPIPVDPARSNGFGSPFDPAGAAGGPPPPLTPLPVEIPGLSAPKPPASVAWDEFARTPDGRPLEKAKFGVGRRLVLVVGPLGGDEEGALATSERLAGWFQEVPDRLSDLRVIVVRTANPDGFARGTRANARGVDLNRNFPTTGWRKVPHGTTWVSGPEPASEPETEALVELIRDERPDAIWIVGSNSAAASVAANPGASAIGAVLARHCGANLRELGAGASGTLARYADELRLPTVSLTLQDDRAPEDCWNRFGPALLAGLTAASLDPAGAVSAVAPTTSVPFDPGLAPAIGAASSVRRVGVEDEAAGRSGVAPGGLTPLPRRPHPFATPASAPDPASVPLEATPPIEPSPAYDQAYAPSVAPLASEPTPAEPPRPVIRSSEPPTSSHPAFNFFQRRPRSSSPGVIRPEPNAASGVAPAPAAAVVPPAEAEFPAEAAIETESPYGAKRPGATPRRVSDWPSHYRPPQPPIPLYDPQAQRRDASKRAPETRPASESRPQRVVPAENET